MNLRFLIGAALAAAVLVSAACQSGGGSNGATQPAGAPAGPGDATRGRALFVQQCIACHTVASIPEARGSIGPDLTRFATQPQIAGTLPNTPENLARWLANPPSIKPGTAMPNLGLNQQQVQDLVAFHETLR